MNQLYVSGNCPSANYPVVLKEIKKNNNKIRRAVIQWSADDWGHILQSANMCKLRLPNHSGSEDWAKLISIYWSFSAPAALAICTQRQGYDLICLSLCVFILLSLLCSLCAPSMSPPCFITTSPLHSSVTLHLGCAFLTRSPSGQEWPLGLGSFNKTGSVWLANIVWAFSWVKLLRDSR